MSCGNQVKKIYTWAEFDDDMMRIVSEIKSLHLPHIVAPYRGALPMGVYLSNKLNLPLSIVDYQSRDGFVGAPKEPVLIKNAGIMSNQTLVIIDDIYDTGLTLNKIRDYLFSEFQETRVKGYCLHRNVRNQVLHSHYADWVTTINDTKKWVQYPWE